MWDLVGNPEDRFSHNEAQMAVTNKVAEAWRIEIVVIWASLIFHKKIYIHVLLVGRKK